MRQTLTLLLLSFLVFNAHSQEIALSKDNDVTNVFKITVLNPGLSYEARIAKLQTLYAQAFLNPSIYNRDEMTAGGSLKMTMDPAATLHYRYYFNGPIRKTNNRRTDMNSMNYLAFITELISSKAPIRPDYYEEKSRRPITSLGFCWGMQRNYATHFTLDLYLGLGYQYAKSTYYDDLTQTKYNENKGKVAILGQFNIGGWLGRKK